MFFTPFDIGVIFIVLVSALLATLRGFSREIFSFFCWLGSAAVAYYFHKKLVPFLLPYIPNAHMAQLLALLILFLLVLILSSIIVLKLSSLILNSILAPLDRFIGFLFGIIRGLLICAVALILITNMVKPENRSAWITQAKTLPMLEAIATKIEKLLPDDFNKLLEITSSLHHQENEETLDIDEEKGVGDSI